MLERWSRVTEGAPAIATTDVPSTCISNPVTPVVKLVLTVNVAVGDPGRFRVGGFMDTVTPTCKTEGLKRLMMPEKLLIGVAVTVKVALPPSGTLWLDGDKAKEKSPVGEALIVKLTVFVVPPGTVTEMGHVRRLAFAEIVRDALIVVLLGVLEPGGLIWPLRKPLQLDPILSEEGMARFVPVSVTGTLVPGFPFAGLIEVNVGEGGAGFTVRLADAVCPWNVAVMVTGVDFLTWNVVTEKVALTRRSLVVTLAGTDATVVSLLWRVTTSPIPPVDTVPVKGPPATTVS